MFSGTQSALLLRILALVVIFCSPARSEIATSAKIADKYAIVTTHHKFVYKSGAVLNYTARAGFIPIFDESTGEVRAKLFFVSYTAQPARDGHVRPLTFFTAGGPGEPATLAEIGPRKLKGAKWRAAVPPPPYEMENNDETWLTTTDLVLIDPIGSGFSQTIQSELSGRYYNSAADAESIAQFVQRFLDVFEAAKRQPIFIAGASYGSIRSVLLADILTRRKIALSGLILISSALADQPRIVQVAPLRGEPPFVIPVRTYAQLLHTFTATAFFHHKLPPDLLHNFADTLGKAESWAASDFPILLAHSDALSSQEFYDASIKMARLTGMPAEVIREHKFRFSPDEFLNTLLGSDWPSIGLADSRMLMADKIPVGSDTNLYPILSKVYLDKELGFKGETPYEPGILTMINGWRCGENPSNCLDPGAIIDLQRIMGARRSLRVMITNGYFDLSCPYFGTKLALDQFDPGLRSRVDVKYYDTGHFPPADNAKDVAQFIQKALALPISGH